MDLAAVAAGAGWMTAGEHRLTEKITRTMGREFSRYGVVVSPLVALRVEDVIVSYLVVRRLETAFTEPTTPEEAKAAAAGIEAAGKARERLRKAMKELEEACAKAGTPIDDGIAGQMKPLLLKTVGVLEDALRFEAEKNSKE